jgi:hypothetical protein
MLAAILLVGAATSPAIAQSAPENARGPALLLEWSGPGPELDCLGEQGLTRAVNDYLGRDAFEPPAELVLHVNVERLPDRHFRAVLAVAAATGRTLGTRELTSSSELCSSLDERLILTVALLADAGPEAPEPPATTREQVPVMAAPGRDDTEDLPTVPVEPPARAAPWGFAVEAALVVEGGLLPSARPGLSLGLQVQPSSWLAARVGGLAFLPASQAVAGASVRFSLFAGTAELCAGELHPWRFQAAVCAGALYAGLGTVTHGAAGGHDRTRGQLAGLLGAHLGEPLSRRITLVGDAGGVFPDRPERFLVQLNSAPHELFQLSKPSVLASLGAAVTF